MTAAIRETTHGPSERVMNSLPGYAAMPPPSRAALKSKHAAAAGAGASADPLEDRAATFAVSERPVGYDDHDAVIADTLRVMQTMASAAASAKDMCEFAKDLMVPSALESNALVLLEREARSGDSTLHGLLGEGRDCLVVDAKGMLESNSHALMTASAFFVATRRLLLGHTTTIMDRGWDQQAPGAAPGITRMHVEASTMLGKLRTLMEVVPTMSQSVDNLRADGRRCVLALQRCIQENQTLRVMLVQTAAMATVSGADLVARGIARHVSATPQFAPGFIPDVEVEKKAKVGRTPATLPPESLPMDPVQAAQAVMQHSLNLHVDNHEEEMKQVLKGHQTMMVLMNKVRDALPPEPPVASSAAGATKHRRMDALSRFSDSVNGALAVTKAGEPDAVLLNAIRSAFSCFAMTDAPLHAARQTASAVEMALDDVQRHLHSGRKRARGPGGRRGGPEASPHGAAGWRVGRPGGLDCCAAGAGGGH